MASLSELLGLGGDSAAPSFFFGDRPSGPGSYQDLQTRRKIAEAMLGKRSPFPKTLGEGLTYAGERFGDVMTMRDLEQRDAAYEAEQKKDAELYRKRLEEAAGTGAPPPPVPTPAATPAPTATPRADAYAPEGVSTAGLSPRDDLTATLMNQPSFTTASDNGPAPMPTAQAVDRSALPPAGPVGNAAARFERPIVNAATGARRDVPTQPSPARFSPEFGRLASVPNARTAPADINAIGDALLSPSAAASSAPLMAWAPPGTDTPMGQRTIARPLMVAAEGGGGEGGGGEGGGGATDIPSAPVRVAQGSVAPLVPGGRATSAYGVPPGAMDPRVSGPEPTSAGGVQQQQPDVTLPPPPIIHGMGPQEIDAMVRMRATRDPEQAQRWADVAKTYADQRAEDYARRKTEWDALARTREAVKLQQSQAAIQQASPEAQEKLRADRAKFAEDVDNRLYGGSVEKATEFMQKPYEAIQPMLALSPILREAKKAANDMWTGKGAVQLQDMSSWLSMVPFGREILGDPANKTATAGQLFAAYMRHLTGPMRTQMGLMGNVSERDFANMLTAVGADPTLQRDAVTAVLNQAQKTNFQGLRQFQQRLNSFTGDSPSRQQQLYDRFPINLERHLPDDAVEAFKQRYARNKEAAIEELNRRTYTPGMAQRLIELHHIGE